MLKACPISKILIILIWSLLNGGMEAAKIFAVIGVPNFVENLFSTAMLNALHERGHEITAVIKFPQAINLNEGINQIVIEENNKINKEILTFSVENFDETFYPNLKKFCGKSSLVVENIMKHPQVQEVLKYKQFDLVLLGTLMSEALYGLGEHFNAPMVCVATFPTSHPLDLLVGNVSPISLIPNLFLQHNYEATFVQRFLNVALKVIDRVIYNFLYLPHQLKHYKKFFPNATLSFDEANRNFSLVLLNQHFSLHYPRPHVPNMIEVAGLHIESENKSLPLNIPNFLDKSSKPIIYIRLSAGVHSFGLKLIKPALILQVLSALNYKVIWHWDHLPLEKPPYQNVLHVSSISHFPILAHPQVKLFITNAEILSITEAVYFEKPILGIPIFADQYININMASKIGYGLGLHFSTLNESKLKEVVQELVLNPTFSFKIKKLSKIFHDQPISPKEKAIYWIEYILRYNGALHLRGKGRFLNFWQFHNIDVFTAYILGFLIIVFLIWTILKCLYLLMNRNKNNFKIKHKSD